jgi:CRP-like cAMP-binding protein
VNNTTTIDQDGLKLVNSGELYKDQLIIMLEQIHLFEDFNQNEINVLANFLKAYQADQGTVLFREGDQAGYMCFLIEGRLEVFKDVEFGQKKKLAEIRAGKSIGEMSVIDNLPNSATVVAGAPSILILLTRRDLQQIAQNQPQLAIKLLWHLANLLSQRLRHTSGRLIDRL